MAICTLKRLAVCKAGSEARRIPGEPLVIMNGRSKKGPGAAAGGRVDALAARSAVGQAEAALPFLSGPLLEGTAA